MCPGDNTIEALREELEYYWLAPERPVFEYADMVPDYDPAALGIEVSF